MSVGSDGRVWVRGWGCFFIYLCKLYDTSQWYVPLMDSAAVLDDEVSGDDISDEECPCGGRGVWYVLAFRSYHMLW